MTFWTTFNGTLASSFFMPRNPSGATNWTSGATLYDRFKVHGMRLRMYLPKYTTVGDAFGTGVVTNLPSSCVGVYDNDAATSTSYVAAIGYDQARVAYADGEVAYGATKLPSGMIAGSTLTGGSLASAEWCDCAYPGNLYGGMTLAIDRGYAGTWVTAPALFSSISVVCEWDVEFSARNSA